MVEQPEEEEVDLSFMAPGTTGASKKSDKSEKKSKKKSKKKREKSSSTRSKPHSSDSEVEMSKSASKLTKATVANAVGSGSGYASRSGGGSDAKDFDDNASVYSEMSYRTKGGTRRTRRVPSRTRGRYKVCVRDSVTDAESYWCGCCNYCCCCCSDYCYHLLVANSLQLCECVLGCSYPYR